MEYEKEEDVRKSETESWRRKYEVYASTTIRSLRIGGKNTDVSPREADISNEEWLNAFERTSGTWLIQSRRCSLLFQGTGVRKWKEDKHVKQHHPKRVVGSQAGHATSQLSSSPKSIPLMKQYPKDGYQISGSSHSPEAMHVPSNDISDEKGEGISALLYHEEWRGESSQSGRTKPLP